MKRNQSYLHAAAVKFRRARINKMVGFLAVAARRLGLVAIAGKVAFFAAPVDSVLAKLVDVDMGRREIVDILVTGTTSTAATSVGTRVAVASVAAEAASVEATSVEAGVSRSRDTTHIPRHRESKVEVVERVKRLGVVVEERVERVVVLSGGGVRRGSGESVERRECARGRQARRFCVDGGRRKKTRGSADGGETRTFGRKIRTFGRQCAEKTTQCAFQLFGESASALKDKIAKYLKHA